MSEINYFNFFIIYDDVTDNVDQLHVGHIN
jgi:hypothetical protein